MNASEKIDQYIANASDWQGDIIRVIRNAIHEVAPDITEEWKWNSPVFSHQGTMICSPGAFKKHVGVNFFSGAKLKDPNNLFNSGQEAKKTRAINYYHGDKVNTPALKELIREAIEIQS